MMRALIFSLPLLSTACLVSAQAAPPVLALPVKCEIGRSCLVQKLVDHDPSPGRQDYRCGNLTTDGHDGVDIRLRTMADMHAGYAVIAAAAGKVFRTRDGEPDISSRVRTNLGGKDAGNAVIIDHGDGWQTQYSHLRQGSVSVRPGQQVAAGERLGLVGMSGNAEFPHLHFTVRNQGNVIDPFVGAGPVEPCNAAVSANGLWVAAAARALGYEPTTIIAAGLASNVPPKAVADRATPPVLTGQHAPMLMWVDMIGAKPGDAQEFRITGPAGRRVHVQETSVVGGGLSWFAYSGQRAPASGWPTGRYVGHYTLRRNGVIIAQTEISGLIR
jgi:Peptidase family M23